METLEELDEYGLRYAGAGVDLESARPALLNLKGVSGCYMCS
jgi:hypothetical protein